MHSLSFQQVTNILCHEPDGFLMIFVVFCVEEFIERKHERPASIIIFVDDAYDALRKPPVELSDLHVVDEIYFADVLDALKSIFCSFVVSDEFGIRLDDVETDVLPNFHVHLLDVQMKEAVVYQIEIALDARALLEQPSNHLYQDLICELFNNRSIDRSAFHAQGLEFVVTGLSSQKLCLFSDNADEL